MPLSYQGLSDGSTLIVLYVAINGTISQIIKIE